MTRTTDRTTGTGSVCADAGPGHGRDEMWLCGALRSTAQRRKVRASALRDWSREVQPPLAQSLRRRAAELELGAVALEQRADGIDGGAPPAEEEHA